MNNNLIYFGTYGTRWNIKTRNSQDNAWVYPGSIYLEFLLLVSCNMSWPQVSIQQKRFDHIYMVRKYPIPRPRNLSFLNQVSEFLGIPHRKRLDFLRINIDQNFVKKSYFDACEWPNVKKKVAYHLNGHVQATACHFRSLRASCFDSKTGSLR